MAARRVQDSLVVLTLARILRRKLHDVHSTSTSTKARKCHENVCSCFLSFGIVSCDPPMPRFLCHLIRSTVVVRVPPSLVLRHERPGDTRVGEKCCRFFFRKGTPPPASTNTNVGQGSNII